MDESSQLAELLQCAQTLNPNEQPVQRSYNVSPAHK